jgi:citrate synthase
MGYSSRELIVVRGHNLIADLLGKANLGDVAFLELTGALPTAGVSRVFNAMLITLVEHGLTPSALVSRLTYLGAPESLQAAVSAGLLGLGSVFVGSMENCARLLQETLERTPPDVSLPAVAREIVERLHREALPVPGLGHPLHKPIDPRAERLFEIAVETGTFGRYAELIRLISTAAGEIYGKELPVNATGAIAALASELGLTWRICRGLGVMARAVGLVGHLLEEMSEPIAREVSDRAEREVSDFHLKQRSAPLS